MTVRCNGAGIAFVGDPSLIVGTNSTLLLDDCQLKTSVFLALVQQASVAPSMFSIDALGGFAAARGGSIHIVGGAAAYPCEVRSRRTFVIFVKHVVIQYFVKHFVKIFCYSRIAPVGDRVTWRFWSTSKCICGAVAVASFCRPFRDSRIATVCDRVFPGGFR